MRLTASKHRKKKYQVKKITTVNIQKNWEHKLAVQASSMVKKKHIKQPHTKVSKVK